MRKSSFTSLLLGFAFVLACSTGSQRALARDGDAQPASPAGNFSAPRQLHKLEKNSPPRTRKKVAAVRGEDVPSSHAMESTQADVVAPQAPLTVAGHTAERRDAARIEAASKHKTTAAQPIPHEIQQFCANTASSAVDARVAWQAAKLVELEVRLTHRIAEFDAKRAEFEDWLHRHDEAMKEAKDDVVAIYSRMRPDAAASQLAVMNDEMAASLLAKLNSRVASAILAEMDPGRAARIANAMAGPVNAVGGKKS
ncbi:MAG TPA: MotE family protein [Methylovirgula sp.]